MRDPSRIRACQRGDRLDDIRARDLGAGFPAGHRGTGEGRFASHLLRDHLAEFRLAHLASQPVAELEVREEDAAAEAVRHCEFGHLQAANRDGGVPTYRFGIKVAIPVLPGRSAPYDCRPVDTPSLLWRLHMNGIHTRRLACAVGVALAINGCSTDAPTAAEATARDVSRAASAVGQVTGVLSDGGSFVGTLRVQEFILHEDRTLSVRGLLSGTATTASGVTRTIEGLSVTAPATLRGGKEQANSSASAAGLSLQQAPGTASCQILFLDLGPLFLDVLGLTVDLNEVVLDITAVAGAGNLLGNLLCAIVHLLDGPGAFVTLLNLLDRINAILATV